MIPVAILVRVSTAKQETDRQIAELGGRRKSERLERHRNHSRAWRERFQQDPART